MQPQESSVGPVVATIVILAVIVLGGLYFWSQRSSSTSPTDYGATNVAVPTGSSTTTDNTIPTPTYDVNATMSGS